MAAGTIAALTSLFKRLYVGKDLSNQALRRTPLFRVIPRLDDLVGEGIYIPYNYGLPVGASATFSRSLANAASSSVARWFVERKRYYGSYTIDGEAIHASKGREGAFLAVKQKEADEYVKYMGMQIGASFWGDGTGVIGRTSTAVTTATDTAALVVPTDAVNFHLKQEIIFNSAVTGGTNRTDRYTVTGINRQTGVISLTRSSGSADDVAINDYMFVDGNHGVAAGAAPSTNQLMTGVDAWIPATDPSTTLLGMTRTDDPTMKAGWRGDWEGTIEESAKALCASMGQYLQSSASGLWLSRSNWFRLEQELSSKNKLMIDDRATAVFGVPAIRMLTPEGDVPVMSDPFCPNGTGYLLDHSSWELHTMESVPHLITDDGNQALRSTTEDSIEMRWRAWLEAVCFRPFTNGRFPIE